MERLNDEAGDRLAEDQDDHAAKTFYSPVVGDHPLDTWQHLKPLALNRRELESRRLVLQPKPDNAQMALDMMRTKVGKALSKGGWKSIAITSPTPGCGKTTLSANLAFGLARQANYKVVLVDLDLRRPAMAKFLGIGATHSMERFLRGHNALRDSFVRYGENLAIGLNSMPVTGSAELLQSPSSTSILKSLTRQLNPDVIIYDMPPMLANDDVLAFLPTVDAALLVVEAGTNSIAEIDICEGELSRQTNLIGVVLNKGRHTPDKYGY